MSKINTTISVNVSSEILFISDNTCCICRERGKAIQIHHIDENPNNHEISNLAVLCLECHNNTQITGGFGRKLSSSVITRYRNEWLDRVKERRDHADHLAVTKIIEKTEIELSSIYTKTNSIPKPTQKPLDYINSLPDFKKKLYIKAEIEWDSGVTARMVQGSYDYIDALQGILVTLASYYPDNHFGNGDPHKFFSEQISARFLWHRSYVEPGGSGTGGTIVNVICCGKVIDDVEKMIENIVMSLVDYSDEFDWRNWPKKWRGKAI